MASHRELVFEEVCSQDFLKFKFGERGYQVSLGSLTHSLSNSLFFLSRSLSLAQILNVNFN
jgi:hypothetical protein